MWLNCFSDGLILLNRSGGGANECDVVEIRAVQKYAEVNPN